MGNHDSYSDIFGFRIFLPQTCRLLSLGCLRRFPCAKRECRRSVEQLDFGVELYEAGAAQLAASGQ